MINVKPIIQKLDADLFDRHALSVDVLRLDLVGPVISGNKWFKLRLNLEAAKLNNSKTIITFGGAFSNHIAATAAACKLYGFNCVGIIRGNATDPLNTTLSLAKENGMTLHFVSRETYREKDSEAFTGTLDENFGPHYLIPEGGNNRNGVLGCAQIVDPQWDYDYVFCACGTGTTFSGIAGAVKATTIVAGISVLKGTNTLPAETERQINSVFPGRSVKISGNEALELPIIRNSCITNNYCFKGYARYDAELAAFKTNFEKKFNIALDHIYTTKLFYGLFDLIEKGKLKTKSNLLVIHSGGLQGNAGFEAFHRSKF